MKNKKMYILFTIFISILAAALVVKEFQNDTFSAIKIGDYIRENGIDFVEHFNMNSGLVYHNARWLFNVILSLINSNFGFTGIYVFVMIINIVIGIVIFNALLKLKHNMIFSFVITILTLFILKGYVCARAQTISYLLFFLEIFFVERLIDTNKKRYIIYIIISSILIANIHTTVWPMTLILLLPYLCEYYVSKFKLIKKSKKLYSNITNVKILWITFILVLLSGFVTPLGFTPYTYMFKTMAGVSSSMIAELEYSNILLDFSFLILTIIYLVIIYFRGKIKISDIFMSLGLFFMSVLAVRNVAFFIIISPIIISRMIHDLTKDKEKSIEIITDRFNKVIYPFIFIGIVIAFMSFKWIMYNSDKEYVNERLYPTKAADYILENIDLSNMRLYNDFDNGAYLEYRGIKVFLDSRSEVYCKEFNDTTILEDFVTLMDGSVHYQDVFDKYSFTHILLYKESMLDVYLKKDNNYKPIYSDEYFVLYEKLS